MFENRISNYLNDTEPQPAEDGSNTPPINPPQGMQMTTLGDIYEAAHKRAVLDCQIDDLFNADDLL